MFTSPSCSPIWTGSGSGILKNSVLSSGLETEENKPPCSIQQWVPHYLSPQQQAAAGMGEEYQGH